MQRCSAPVSKDLSLAERLVIKSHCTRAKVQIQSCADWGIIKSLMLVIINVLIRSHIGVIYQKYFTALIIVSNADLNPETHSKGEKQRGHSLPASSAEA